MLNRIEIENFRSLKAIDLELTPLTVLIGPNGGGKSNFLDVFELLSEGSKGFLSDAIAKRGGFDSIRFRGAKEDKIFFKLEYPPIGVFKEEQKNISYKIQLRSVGTGVSIPFEQLARDPFPPHTSPLYLVNRHQGQITFLNKELGEKDQVKQLESESELAIQQIKDENTYPTPYKLLRQIQEWMFYNPIDVGFNAPIRSPQLTRSGTRLLTSGENLTSVLYVIQQQYPSVWDEICELLQIVYPEFRYMTFPPEGGDGKIVLRWWESPFEKSNSGFSANLLSDGTLRLLSLIAILKNPNPPPLVCIDEPEVGLHPDWIKLVGELLDEAGTRMQLIVVTHSPDLISKIKPSNIVIVEKEDGATLLERLDEKELEGWLENFRLGELWRSGHLGGAS
jgi:predicted ATPase